MFFNLKNSTCMSLLYVWGISYFINSCVISNDFIRFEINNCFIIKNYFIIISFPPFTRQQPFCIYFHSLVHFLFFLLFTYILFVIVYTWCSQSESQFLTFNSPMVNKVTFYLFINFLQFYFEKYNFLSNSMLNNNNTLFGVSFKKGIRSWHNQNHVFIINIIVVCLYFIGKFKRVSNRTIKIKWNNIRQIKEKIYKSQ